MSEVSSVISISLKANSNKSLNAPSNKKNPQQTTTTAANAMMLFFFIKPSPYHFETLELYLAGGLSFLKKALPQTLIVSATKNYYELQQPLHKQTENYVVLPILAK
jgi:gamma-glutamyl:cysteine ligase YbdK (ATP-grasp superfamily)